MTESHDVRGTPMIWPWCSWS